MLGFNSRKRVVMTRVKGLMEAYRDYLTEQKKAKAVKTRLASANRLFESLIASHSVEDLNEIVNRLFQGPYNSVIKDLKELVSRRRGSSL